MHAMDPLSKPTLEIRTPYLFTHISPKFHIFWVEKLSKTPLILVMPASKTHLFWDVPAPNTPMVWVVQTPICMLRVCARAHPHQYTIPSTPPPPRGALSVQMHQFSISSIRYYRIFTRLHAELRYAQNAKRTLRFAF